MKTFIITSGTVVPAGARSVAQIDNTVINISAVSFAAGVSTYTYTVTSGPALQGTSSTPGIGRTITITGMADSVNNGAFIIQTVPNPTTFSVNNASGITRASQSGTGNCPLNEVNEAGIGYYGLTGFYVSDTSTQAPLWGTWGFGAAYLNQPYSHSWDMENVASPVTYSVLSGTLPTGLALNNIAGAEGSITGTPTVLGTFTFTLRAVNAAGTVDQAFSITVSMASGASGGAFVFIS